MQAIPVRPFSVRVKSKNGTPKVCPVILITVSKDNFDSEKLYFGYVDEGNLEFIGAFEAKIVI